MDKIKAIVSVYGDKYLMHIPTSGFYAKKTLVALLLGSSYTADFGDLTYTMLEYLIHTCPAALRIQSLSPHGDNAFSVLCENWNDPGIARHVWVVDHVMRHANITDILDTVPAHNTTLLGYAKKVGNVLVLNYIQERFSIE